MAINQINKITWLVDILLKCKKLTFEQINQMWQDNEDMSSGEPLSKRTFHYWRYQILDTFGLLIDCDKTAPYKYFLANSEEIDKNNLAQWLLNTYSASNNLYLRKQLKNRILLENIPSNRKYLDQIITAMKLSVCINITYYNYWTEKKEKKYIIEPYCVKLFKQRWYVIANLSSINKVLIFSLDRIRNIDILEDKYFVFPKDFSPKEYFANCFGIINNKDITPPPKKLLSR